MSTPRIVSRPTCLVCFVVFEGARRGLETPVAVSRALLDKEVELSPRLPHVRERGVRGRIPDHGRDGHVSS